jgi:hypothetical protein
VFFEIFTSRPAPLQKRGELGSGDSVLYYRHSERSVLQGKKILTKSDEQTGRIILNKSESGVMESATYRAYNKGIPPLTSIQKEKQYAQDRSE